MNLQMCSPAYNRKPPFIGFPDNYDSPALPNSPLSLAQRGLPAHFPSVKTLAVEEIYANPHALDY